MYLNTFTKEELDSIKKDVNQVIKGYEKFPQSLVQEDKGIPLPNITMVNSTEGMDYKEGVLRTKTKNVDPNVHRVLFDIIRRDLQDICSGKIDCTEYMWSNRYGFDVEEKEDYINVTIRFYYLIK